MDQAKIRKAALAATKHLEDILTNGCTRDSIAKALTELSFIAENSKRERTDADRARDRRRSRKKVDTESMKAKLEALKQKDA